MIHINQIGYKDDERKEVFINSPEEKIEMFQVVNIADNKVVYEGPLTGPVKDGDTGDTIYTGDFTQVKKPGEYFIEVTGLGRSFNFRIEKNIYSEVRDALLKVMYYQRCGIALDEEYAGTWKHDICHLKDAYLYENQEIKIDTTGGWHDAGDYGKYVVPAAKTVADLLLSYDFLPGVFSDKLNIPESNNGIPDILDEARAALEWMFKMQNSENGGVYHKVTTRNFIGMDMPETSKEKRYIFSVTSTATADFAAVMAMAGRLYSTYDQEFSTKAISAAEKAWEWLINNPDTEEYQNPPGVNTGVYGDDDDQDERFWAAVELFRVTGNKKYHKHIKKNYLNNFNKTTLDWQHVGGYGVISYLFIDRTKRNNKIYSKFKKDFIEDADQMVKRGKGNPYGISLDNYIWGSNGLLMDQALILILASIINDEKAGEYLHISKNNFNYLLGCNALDQCYVTGFGSKSILFPHHRPSIADCIEAPVPGMVAGGPNQNLQDPILREAVAEDIPPARAFVDAEGGYSANEITTYWNSPAVFVAGYFSNVDHKIKIT